MKKTKEEQDQDPGINEGIIFKNMFAKYLESRKIFGFHLNQKVYLIKLKMSPPSRTVRERADDQPHNAKKASSGRKIAGQKHRTFHLQEVLDSSSGGLPEIEI